MIRFLDWLESRRDRYVSPESKAGYDGACDGALMGGVVAMTCGIPLAIHRYSPFSKLMILSTIDGAIGGALYNGIRLRAQETRRKRDALNPIVGALFSGSIVGWFNGAKVGPGGLAGAILGAALFVPTSVVGQYLYDWKRAQYKAEMRRERVAREGRPLPGGEAAKPLPDWIPFKRMTQEEAAAANQKVKENVFTESMGRKIED